MSLSEDVSINQNFRGMEIGGWRSRRMEDNGAHNNCFIDRGHKTLSGSREALKP